MMIVISKFLLFVMMTTAAAVAADISSNIPATKLAIEEEKPLLNNKERAITTTTPELVEVSAADGDAISAQRKLSKSSKKVKHPEALCTLSLFADSLFMYANQCFTDIMVTISACDDKDDTCYISEQLPLLPQEHEENQEEEQCVVGGLFPTKENIRYNPSTGDCEFLYVDLPDDNCNLYTGDTGTGSLGLKARINVKNNPDVMFIQFTNNKGLTFYNYDDERVAKRSIDRYLRQEGETKPVLSMTPHPFVSHHRRLTGNQCTTAIFDGDFVKPLTGDFYARVNIKNDTPYEAYYVYVDYMTIDCEEEDVTVISGYKWTGPARGTCLVKDIKAYVRNSWGGTKPCIKYDAGDTGTGYSEFYIIYIDEICCVRSWAQSKECPEPNWGGYFGWL